MIETLDCKVAFGDNLKRIRKERGMTQADLARAAGLTQSSISHYEAGDRWPEYEPIVALCKALKVETTDLTSHPGWSSRNSTKNIT